MKDYYRVLSVDGNADREEIRRAFRRLAFRYLTNYLVSQHRGSPGNGTFIINRLWEEIMPAS